MKTNYYDADLNATVAVYAGFMKAEEFYKVGAAILEQAKAHQVSKVLVDTSALQVMPQQNQQYVKEVWASEALKAGIRFMAFILPHDHIGRLSVQDTNQVYANSLIKAEHFTHEAEARAWLKSIL